MPRLNENQITVRVANLLRDAQKYILGLDPKDKLEICRRVCADLMPETAPVVEEKEIGDKIVKAIHHGLDRSDPQMVRAAIEYEEKRAGLEYLTELNVSIVDYRIKDASLAKIVSEADDETVRQIEAALAARKNVTL